MHGRSGSKATRSERETERERERDRERERQRARERKEALHNTHLDEEGFQWPVLQQWTSQSSLLLQYTFSGQPHASSSDEDALAVQSSGRMEYSI